MKINFGFFQADLKAFHYRRENAHNGTFASNKENIYEVIYVIEGVASYTTDKAKFDLKKGDIAIAMPNEYHVFSSTLGPFETIMIGFHPFVFNQPEGDVNFLRAFTDRPIGEACIYNLQDFTDDNIKTSLEAICKCIQLHAGRVHIAANLMTVISELCFAHDRRYPTEEIAVSDNISVKMMAYISSHYCEKISLEKICKRFFVAASTVNVTVLKNTGLSFWSYVTFLRLEEAKRLIGLNNKLKIVAESCGFLDYSSFFRACVKHYGHSPKYISEDDEYDEYLKQKR